MANFNDRYQQDKNKQIRQIRQKLRKIVIEPLAFKQKVIHTFQFKHSLLLLSLRCITLFRLFWKPDSFDTCLEKHKRSGSASILFLIACV